MTRSWRLLIFGISLLLALALRGMAHAQEAVGIGGGGGTPARSMCSIYINGAIGVATTDYGFCTWDVPITIRQVNVAAQTASTGCTVRPDIQIKQTGSSTNIADFTMINGITGFSITGLSAVVQTGLNSVAYAEIANQGTGCGSTPANIMVTLLYTTN